jgi:hypothetical protein
MVDRVFKVILLLSPIIYCFNIHPYQVEMIFFQCSAIALFISSLFDTPKREFNLKYLTGIYLGLCLYSVVVNGFSNVSMTALTNCSFGCLSLYIIVVYSTNLQNYFKWFGLGIIINTIVFLFQIAGYSPIITDGLVKGQEGGIIGSGPRFAYFLALITPFVPIGFLLPIFIIGMYLRESIVVISALIMAFYKNWFLCYSQRLFFVKVSIIVLTGIALVFLGREELYRSFMLRLRAWEPVVNHLCQRPLLGLGLSNYKLTTLCLSSLLQWVYGVGVLGFGFIAICVKRMDIKLIPLFLLCLVESPFETIRLWPVIILTIGVYAIKQKEERLC